MAEPVSSPGELRLKPPCSRADATAVVARLREAGHVAYFAGGCVRDLLLGLEPKDYDVATDAPPKRVRQLFANTQAVGAAFGVILVRLNRSVVEVATFRAEGNYEDGRRPSEVRFTTAEEDAQRRDFTINGLFMDPLDGDRVIDFVGGLADISTRTLRAVGDPAARFAEDHLRLLRAVRFAARFALNIDPVTADAVARHAPSLKRISPERIADELRGMLTPGTRNVAWPLLWQFGLSDVVFRFLPRVPARALDASRSVFLATAPGATISFGLALAAATLCAQLHAEDNVTDVRALLGKPCAQKAVHAMRTGLKISNDESDEMFGAIEGAGLLLADSPPTVAQLKRFLARPSSGSSRHLLEAISAVGHFADRIAGLRAQLAELESTDYAPTPLITGDDLTAAGMSPGPVFKRVLDAVYDAQLESRVTSKGHALRLALQLAQESR